MNDCNTRTRTRSGPRRIAPIPVAGKPLQFSRLASSLPVLFFVFLLAAALTGCGVSGNSSYQPPDVVPPTVFPAASTQTWLQQFGTNTLLPPARGATTAADNPTGVAVDLHGNIVVAGYTYGAFPGYSNAAAVPEGFLAKFRNDGKRVWLRQFQQQQAIGCNQIAIDRHGNILTVALQSTGSAGGTSTGANATVVDKFSRRGHLRWTHPVPLTSTFSGAAIAVDSQGNIAVMVAQQATSQGLVSSIVLKLDGATGQVLWQQTLNGGTYNSFGAIAIDSLGNVIVIGVAKVSTSGYISGEQTQIVKLASDDGQRLWIQQPYSQMDFGRKVFYSVAVDAQDNILVGGTTYTYPVQCLLGKFSGETGKPIWQQQFSAIGGSFLTTVNVDPEGNVIATGTTQGNFASSFTLPAQNNFVVKFNPDGQNIWAQQFGTGPVTLLGSTGPFVTTDAQGNIIVTGMTTGAYQGFSNPKHAAEVYLVKFGP